MPVETLRRAMARFPGADFVQGFGMTELSGNVLYFDPASHRLAATERPELLAAAGRTMALSRIRLVDDDMRDVGVGEVGEIVVRGDQVMLGYWRRPEANEEAFAGGWFHTGDLGRADEQGYTAIVDRKKDMIVTGGENVYSKEVEDVIYAVPGVAEASIIGLPDPHWGENVTAVVVRDAGATVTAERRRRRLPGVARRLQEAEAGGVRRRAAAQRQRQDPQAGAARPLQLSEAQPDGRATAREPDIDGVRGRSPRTSRLIGWPAGSAERRATPAARGTIRRRSSDGGAMGAQRMKTWRGAA